MDFQFTPEDEAFRLEVRDFLRHELPPDWVGIVNNDMLAADEFDIEVRMRKALAKQGWLTLGWPKEYGGAEASPMRQVIFTEEVSYALAPGRDSQGIGMVGPCLMIHGTDEQKRRHIPPIAGGEVVWCQGFSEPGSGSDLASLQTRAERDGDDYVINGQKVWTSYAHRADWMHVLTRTDPEAPKHRGISYFMLDMKTQGINIRPLINITGGHGFNDIYFDNVRVPAENMLGEENRGWYVATTTLDFERSSLNFAAALRRVLEEFVRYLKEARPSGAPSPTDPVLRNKLADLFLSLRVGRNLRLPRGLATESGQDAQHGGLPEQALRHRGLPEGGARPRPAPRPRGAAWHGRPARAAWRSPGACVPALHQHDHRRRHVGDPAQYRRDARAGPAALGRGAGRPGLRANPSMSVAAAFHYLFCKKAKAFGVALSVECVGDNVRLAPR